MTVKITKGKASHKKEQHWPMQIGGPYSKQDGDAAEIFKCTGCGAETEHPKGWNGEPSKHNCHPGCSCQSSDWNPGRVSNAYRNNYERTFGHP